MTDEKANAVVEDDDDNIISSSSEGNTDGRQEEDAETLQHGECLQWLAKAPI